MQLASTACEDSKKGKSSPWNDFASFLHARKKTCTIQQKQLLQEAGLGLHRYFIGNMYAVLFGTGTMTLRFVQELTALVCLQKKCSFKRSRNLERSSAAYRNCPIICCIFNSAAQTALQNHFSCWVSGEFGACSCVTQWFCSSVSFSKETPNLIYIFKVPWQYAFRTWFTGLGKSTAQQNMIPKWMQLISMTTRT